MFDAYAWPTYSFLRAPTDFQHHHSMGNKIVSAKKAKALSSSELRKKKKERMGTSRHALYCPPISDLCIVHSPQEARSAFGR